jgi:hypothetical protein
LPPCVEGVCGQQDILWTGLESKPTPSAVIQPVVNYGTLPPGCSGDPTSWNVLNYYIDQNGNGYCGFGGSVSPGEIILGVVEVDTTEPCNNSGVGCSWGVGFSVDNSPIYWNEAFNVPFSWDTAILGSLELYNAPQCTDLPNAGGGTPFGYATFIPGPQWNNFNNATTSNGYIHLLTQRPPPFPSGVATTCGYGVSLQGTNQFELLYSD